MARLHVYKRNSQFIDLSNLVEELSSLGLTDTLQKHYNKPLEKEAKSIVAGPSFLQFLNKLFQIQITIIFACDGCTTYYNKAYVECYKYI